MSRNRATLVNGLQERIERREAVIGVVGLGYVGLPLMVELGNAGFHMLGFDIDQDRVDALRRGISHIADVDSAVFSRLVSGGTVTATTDFAQLRATDVVIICVPTPLSKTRDPDISMVVNASNRVVETLHAGQLVILESTTYPGTTEDLLLPMLQSTGLHVGEDFFLAFSSERVDPGNGQFTIRNTPKVVGGVTPDCLQLASLLYETIVETVVRVSSPTVAELSKLHENTFRAVNIALANELAQIARVLNVDVWEVIQAASTKPFGFMPFYPGPGLGGHCIPVDPHYLAWKLRSLNYTARFVELASEVNGEMPYFVVELVTSALNEQRKAVNGARILILGAAYKPDIEDLRESPAIDVMTLLKDRHADVVYADSYVPRVRVGEEVLHAEPLSEELISAADCVVIITAHSDVDYEWVVSKASLVVDTRNATTDLPASPHVWRLTRPGDAAMKPVVAPAMSSS